MDNCLQTICIMVHHVIGNDAAVNGPTRMPITIFEHGDTAVHEPMRMLVTNLEHGSAAVHEMW